jgi:cell wall-associated NlpC family hydrolase
MLRPRRAVIAAVVAVAVTAIAAVALASSGGGGQRATASAGGTKPVRTEDGPALPPPLKQRPKAVQAVGPGQAPPSAGVTAGNHSGKPTSPESDEEVRAQLNTFREHLKTVGTPQGPIAKVLPDGTAVAPRGVPGVVLAVIAAGNEIATKPYKWGGGHGAWRDSGYDCSGSVSFALAGAGLLESPLNSTGFMKYGEPGRGRWITILANDGHMFMVVAGLRFDTSGAQGGTRWQPMNGRSYAGFTVRHPPGL